MHLRPTSKLRYLSFNTAPHNWGCRKFFTRNKIVPLKSFPNSVRSYMICQKKGNSRTFKHPYQNSTIFQGFQGLEKVVINFKYLQALQGPVQTLFFIADNFWEQKVQSII